MSQHPRTGKELSRAIKDADREAMAVRIQIEKIRHDQEYKKQLKNAIVTEQGALEKAHLQLDSLDCDSYSSSEQQQTAFTQAQEKVFDAENKLDFVKEQFDSHYRISHPEYSLLLDALSVEKKHIQEAVEEIHLLQAHPSIAEEQTEHHGRPSRRGIRVR